MTMKWVTPAATYSLSRSIARASSSGKNASKIAARRRSSRSAGDLATHPGRSDFAVPLVGVFRDDAEGALLAATAEEQRGIWLLDRLRLAKRVPQLIIASVEIGPSPGVQQSGSRHSSSQHPHFEEILSSPERRHPVRAEQRMYRGGFMPYSCAEPRAGGCGGRGGAACLPPRAPGTGRRQASPLPAASPPCPTGSRRQNCPPLNPRLGEGSPW